MLQQPGHSASPVAAAPHSPAPVPAKRSPGEHAGSLHRVPAPCPRTAPAAGLSPHCLCEQQTAREGLVIPTVTVSQQAKGIQESVFL